MKLSIDTAYLLMLVGGTAGLIILLNYVQRFILTKLTGILYKENNSRKYLKLLEDKKLGLIFRKSTLLLLELNGHLLTGNLQGIQKVYDKAAVTGMNRNERLELYRKLLDFFVKEKKDDQARIQVKNIESLLAGEKDSKLKLILEDTKLLFGVYIEKDTTLIPRLLKLQKQQTGSMSGMTDYRLAKLYWYAKDQKRAMENLELAKANLTGTAWEPVILQALEDPTLLESI